MKCDKIVRIGRRVPFGTINWWKKMMKQVEIGKMDFLNFLKSRKNIVKGLWRLWRTLEVQAKWF
jgi:hypothetical protein